MDVESSTLLSMMNADKVVTNLMIAGTCRDNEVNNNHLVTRLIHNIEEAKRKLTHIAMKKLKHEDINDFLSDALSIPPLETYALIAMFYEKLMAILFLQNRH